MPNSVDPDQMLHSAASDLGLHCLTMSFLVDAQTGLSKWVHKAEKKIHWAKTKGGEAFFVEKNMVLLSTNLLHNA